MADDNVIAFTEHVNDDGEFVHVDVIEVAKGEIEEKTYVDGVDPEDEEAVAEAEAIKAEVQAKVDAANEAAEAGENDTLANTEGAPVTDTSNQFDIPEPPEKTDQQIHDEAVTAGNAAGPANAGVSTGEWVDAKQEEGELPSDEEANAARDDSAAATGEPAAADAVPADPEAPEVKKATKAKKTS